MATQDPEGALGKVTAWSMRRIGQAPLYCIQGREALSHLYRVASGLDSLVIGDAQILGQLRSAGRQARLAGSSKGILSSVFDSAVEVGSRVGTNLRARKESVATLAIAFARKKLGRPPKGVLLVGTGKISRIAASSLGGRVRVATRRPKLPPSFAGAERVGWSRIREALSESELVICATSGSRLAVTTSDVKDTKRRVILDLGFPRNVDPRVRGRGRTQLFDLDDLARVVKAPDDPSVAQALAAVEAESSRFERWLNASKLAPELPAMFQWAEAIRVKETEGTLRRLDGLSPREKRLVEALGRRITSKVLAKPAAFAKLSTPDLPQEQRMKLLREIFIEERP